MNLPSEGTSVNYYNYFTEAEDHFRQVRNSGMFLFSPLDWALLETWKDAGVPLDAVLRGIDSAFEKFRARKRRHSTVNSLAYCAQEVMRAAQQGAQTAAQAVPPTSPSLDPRDLADFFRERARELRSLSQRGSPAAGVFAETASSLDELGVRAEADALRDLEAVERRLTVLEDRVLAVAMSAISEDDLVAARQEMDAQLRPYRRKMTADQIAVLEQRFLRRKSLEVLGVSRLSLFYLG